MLIYISNYFSGNEFVCIWKSNMYGPMHDFILEKRQQTLKNNGRKHTIKLLTKGTHL